MFQLFIVFHKKIFDECYQNIPRDVLDKYFTFVAVSRNIPKEYTKNKYKVINEWELPVYDNSFQERGYNENSALYHIYANNLHKEYKYVGFFQYDMTFNDNVIEFLYKTLEVDDRPKYFSLEPYNFTFCAYNTWNERYTLNYILKDYEAYFNVTFDKMKKYPLYNTYVISTETYEKVMKWVTQLYNKLYPECIKPPNRTHFGHIGTIYERIMAFAIGGEDMEQLNLNVKHDDAYKKVCYPKPVVLKQPGPRPHSFKLVFK
jgi:hypothetical protein